MSEPNALDPAVQARVRASFGAQTMLATLGATLVEMAPGRVVLEMPSDARFGQQFGYTHAGAVTTLLDTACGYAALTSMADDREVLTVDFTSNFLAPAVGDRFRATATVLRSGRTIVVTRADAHALTDGSPPRLVAAMQATMMAVAAPTAGAGSAPPDEPAG